MPHADVLTAAQTAAVGFAKTDVMADFVAMDKDWADRDVWRMIQTYSTPYTAGYFLNAADLQLTPDGVAWRPENERVYITLFIRTLIMSTAITVACIFLGYPIGVRRTC